MTLPYERTRSVLDTAQFLRELLGPKAGWPRTARDMRHRVRTLLRHYPWAVDMVEAGRQAPGLFDAGTACQFVDGEDEIRDGSECE